MKKKTFNRTNTSIDWAGWSWNPVTGCLHGCRYCYARVMARRFKGTFNNFKPTFHPDRLEAPQNTKVPVGGGIRDRAVFTSSMGDLFGRWVPQKWIDRVLDAVRGAPQWTFIFLTKNPKRMATVRWPGNAWAGTTVDSQARVRAAEAAFRRIDAPVRFVSCEPLLEPVRFGSMEMFDWLIIGARSRTTTGPEFQPERAWVESLFRQARKAGCSIYCKPNLRVRNLSTRPRKYPVGANCSTHSLKVLGASRGPRVVHDAL